jgi:8-oxo-dGTP pyrophosphatase MutT (NUDIX family)
MNLLVKSWKRIGTAAFWVSWPLLYLHLRRSTRTRILVVCGEEVLVVKTWLGVDRWALPGGGLRRGEDPLRGALRELREETGLELAADTPKPLFTGTYRQNGLKFNYRCFLVELPAKPPVAPHRPELSDAAWVHRRQLTPQSAGQDVLTAIAKRFSH